jgi:hypothetical protein
MLVQLTSANSKDYIGHTAVFTTRNQTIMKKITGVSESGKTIYIDHPDLQNSLQLVTRKVFVQTLEEQQTLEQQEELLKILESLEERYNIIFNQEFQRSLMEQSYKDAIQSILTSIATTTNFTTL